MLRSSWLPMVELVLYTRAGLMVLAGSYGELALWSSLLPPCLRWLPSPYMSGIARYQRTYEPTGHRVSLMRKALMFRAYEYTGYKLIQLTLLQLSVSHSIIEYYPVLLKRYPLSIEISIRVRLLEACFTTLRPLWK